MQTSNAADTIVLELQASVAGDVLQVTYALVNRTAHSVVVFDGATGTGGGPFPDLTGQCYVSYADGSARVLRIRPGPHPTMDTTRILMPSASEVAPQEMRKVQFHLQLPLKERAEYSPDYVGATYEKHRVQRLEMRLGYFFKTAETVLKPMEKPGVLQVVKGAPLSQMFQISQVCPTIFEMLVRTDANFLRM
jgi:hypothetical protein